MLPLSAARPARRGGSCPGVLQLPTTLVNSAANVVILSAVPRFFPSRGVCAARDAVEGPLFDVSNNRAVVIAGDVTLPRRIRP